LVLPAVPARRAAQILGVNRRSVYRYFEAGALELVPRQGGKAWVSIRSIAEFMKKHYAPSDDFNALVAMDSRPPTK
jgi:predicted site-specific integrase-resolvase